MPSSTIPIDPNLVIPKPKEEDWKKRPEEEPPQRPKTVTAAKPGDPPPDVSDIIDEINERLSKPWMQNELRCGRSIAFGNRLDAAQLKETAKIVAALKWRVTITSDRGGITMSIMPPIPEKKGRPDGRGQRGYL